MASMLEDDFETVIENLSIMDWDGGVPMDIDHPREMCIEFLDDNSFISEAKHCLERDPPDKELESRLEQVLIDRDKALPHNQNIDITTNVLRDYGIVVQDSSNSSVATLSGMIADTMSLIRTTSFKIKANNREIPLPPSTLLLRRICVALNIAIIMPSTRAKTRVFRTKTPVYYVGLLHVGNSFEEVSIYSPLTVSATRPSRPRPPLSQSATTEAESLKTAVYRDDARQRKAKSSLKDLDFRKANEFFEEECVTIIKTDIINVITKMLPGYHAADNDTVREQVISKAFDSAKKAVLKHGNDKTPPRGSMAT
ncbi:hypothetical protein BGZ83_003910, partial [Gryganskiella cystojenkinii]